MTSNSERLRVVHATRQASHLATLIFLIIASTRNFHLGGSCLSSAGTLHINNIILALIEDISNISMTINHTCCRILWQSTWLCRLLLILRHHQMPALCLGHMLIRILGYFTLTIAATQGTLFWYIDLYLHFVC